MNKTQALKEAVKRWGKDAAVQDKGAKLAGTPESRAAGRAALTVLNALTPEEKKAKRKERDDALFACYRYRYVVGYIALGMMFAVHGSGDTWEEAFHEADNRFKSKAA